jgi:hypothetical protein
MPDTPSERKVASRLDFSSAGLRSKMKKICQPTASHTFAGLSEQALPLTLAHLLLGFDNSRIH